MCIDSNIKLAQLNSACIVLNLKGDIVNPLCVPFLKYCQNHALPNQNHLLNTDGNDNECIFMQKFVLQAVQSQLQWVHYLSFNLQPVTRKCKASVPKTHVWLDSLVIAAKQQSSAWYLLTNFVRPTIQCFQK